MANLKPMTRIETDFVFFYNTEFTNYQNTRIFKDNQERDTFFLKSDRYKKKTFSSPFNFIMDKSSIRIPNTNYFDYYTMLGINYCTFVDSWTGKRIYAYVTDIKYINSGVTQINLLIDGLMTYCQGRVLEEIKPVNIIRQHLPKDKYNLYLNEIKNNDDIINTYSKNYFFETSFSFKNYVCIMLSSADLTSDFGTVDQPKIETSTGGTFDKISSPLDIYAVKQKKYREFNNKLKKYPWIAQNIQKVILVPSEIISLNNHFQLVKTKFNFSGLYKMKNNLTSDDSTTRIDKELDSVSFTYDELMDLYNLDKEQDKHILRSGYTTLEVYAWNGQKIDINLSKIGKDGLKFRCEKILGYENEIAIFPINYDYKQDDNKSRKLQVGRQYEQQLKHFGSYLNNAIFFTNFDTVPVLIDNARLSWAKTANQRQLNENRLISNRIQNVMNPKTSLETRFYDSASILSNLSPSNLLGKFTDEYEFYRNQKAEFKDLSLQVPSLTEQTTGNSFQIKYNNFGITLKFAKPDDTEIEKIKTYYKAYGYEFNRIKNNIEDIFSMTVCNYLQVKGNFYIKDVPTPIMEQIRIQLENGVRLWHTDFSNINNNKIRR